MGSLVRSELVRFRLPSIGLAVLHLLMLRLSMTIAPLFSADAAKTSVGVLSYGLLGLGLGVYQMSTYRRGHLWAWLVHRPMAVGRIFAGLAASATALLLLVVALPALLMTVYVDWLTPTYVDLRHYAVLPYLFGYTFCCYGLGALVATHPRRASALVGVLLVFFLSREASGLWIFGSLLAAAAWIFALAWSAFRPSPTSPEKRPAAVLGAALPAAYAIFWILVGGILVTRSFWIIFTEHGPGGLQTFAWNDYWGEGELPHTSYLDPEETTAHGLRLAAAEGGPDAATAAALLAQIDLADVSEPRGPRFSGFPDRHQLFFDDRRHEMVDAGREVGWAFSHDLMLFTGTHLRTGQSAGFMGRRGAPSPSPGGLEPFDGIPFVVESKWLVFPRRIVEIDFELGRFDLRFELPPGETVAMPFQVHRSFATVLSSERLYLFDPRPLALDDGPVKPIAAVDLPGPERDLSRFQVAEMIDSYLISFVVGERNFRDFGAARQVVVEVPIGDGDSGAGADPSPRVVADLALGSGYPDWFRRRGFLLSPVLRHGHDLLWNVIGPDREERVSWADIRARPVPGDVLLATASLSLLALLGAYGVLAWRRISGSERVMWLGFAAAFGIPGALTCLAFTRRDESVGLESVAPSPRAVAVPLLEAEGSPS
ncbi:MAG: hypothetical protein AAGF23_23760 [Acidobacteriota bacterium]